jgi:hypothetical protein
VLTDGGEEGEQPDFEGQRRRFAARLGLPAGGGGACSCAGAAAALQEAAASFYGGAGEVAWPACLGSGGGHGLLAAGP